MKFIQLGFSGRNGFLTYLSTFLMTIFSMLGFGLVPYTYALSRAGLDVDKHISTEEAIDALGKNTFLALQLFPFVLALFVLIFCIKFIHRRPVTSLFTTRESFDWKRFLVSFTLWGLMMFAMLYISFGMSEGQYEWNFDPATFGMLLTISIFVIPLQTAFEEAFFRGWLFQGTGIILRKGWLTVLFTGLLFGLLHGSNPEVEILGTGILVYYIVTGFFLGLLALMDEGLELSIGFHAVNNIFGALIITNKWQVFQSDALWMDLAKPSFGWDSIVSMLVCLPLLILIFARIYRWKNWKQKLLEKIEKNQDQDVLKGY